MAALLHESTRSLVDQLLAQGRDLAPHLKAALERLSPEHPSGIALVQLETPMMKQFISVKNEVPDGIVFFRMGDFFELFGADAIIAAEICGLTLTSRDKNSDSPVPMAGVPVVSYRAALKKCVQAGYKVAVCDQVEDPRTAKGIVKREIVRIATPAVPGDLSDEESAESALGCYLAAAACGAQGMWAFCYVDVSTGEFRITGGLARDMLEQEILTLSPREILFDAQTAQSMGDSLRGLFQTPPRIGLFEPWVFRSEKECLAIFGEFFKPQDLHQFGLGTIDLGLQVVAGVLSYLKSTQRNVLKNLKSIHPYALASHLMLDDATKRHLDFFSTASGERKGSLFWFLNRCVTPGGARALARRLNYPFKSKAALEAAQACVAAFVDLPEFERKVTEDLRQCGDLDRLMARTAQGHIDPKGLAWMRQSLLVLPLVAHRLCAPESNTGSNIEANTGSHTEEGGVSHQALVDLATAALPAIEALQPLTALLQKALADDPANALGKGGRIFQEGHSPELDEVVALESNIDSLINALEAREREKTQISSLKIGFTRAFGYYFEISKGKAALAPAHFIRKQTLTTGERYITADLKELEEKILTASEKRGVLERELFDALVAQVLLYAESMAKAAAFLAQVDVARTFAALAKEHGWARPTLAESAVIYLKDSVHPILQSLLRGGEAFVPNTIAVGETASLGPVALADVGLNGSSAEAMVLLITGPNMAGKSTVMRQVALSQVLFQMGSFVPAKVACMGLCDRIFTRIGSSDFALKNQSTFMVEMLETAHMLRYATPSSLLLMDEIGRGTSTYDGVSLAWAILEDLHDRVHARTLFSTHYHELQEVTRTRPQIRPMQMEVIERERVSENGTRKWEILFSRRFKAGAAGKSYGLHVAELAGIGQEVLGRAASILAGLSAHEAGLTSEVVLEAVPAAVPTVVPAEVPAEAPAQPLAEAEASIDEALELLLSHNPDSVTPMAALELLYKVRELILKSGRAGVSEKDSGATKGRKPSRQESLLKAHEGRLFDL